MIRRIIQSFILVLIFSGTVLSQSDSSYILEAEELISIVLKNHPLIKQAELISESGRLDLKKARGAFDPVLYHDFSEKQFDQKKYYSLLNGGLKVPTWFGVEAKMALEQNEGYNLNPENNTPPAGLLVSGISIPIGKGLIIDQRRMQLRQAQAYKSKSEYDQFQEINNILYEASKQYWHWVTTGNNLLIYENSLLLAKQRLDGVKKSYLQGDKPAIDTLEAFIQYQNRAYAKNNAQLEWIEASLILSNYLWNEALEPLELQPQVRPPQILDQSGRWVEPLPNERTFLEFNSDQHPIIKSYELKLKALDYYKRYKAEGLKPKLNLNYNFLTEPVNGNVLTGYSPQNYKLGLEFKLPLFFREQVAEYKLSKLKVENTRLAQTLKRREIENKIRYYLQELQNLRDQEQLTASNAVNYQRLLDAEKRKYEIGESSLFLINSRENKLIEAQIKLVSIRGKYQKSKVALYYALGLGVDTLQN